MLGKKNPNIISSGAESKCRAEVVNEMKKIKQNIETVSAYNLWKYTIIFSLSSLQRK